MGGGRKQGVCRADDHYGDDDVRFLFLREQSKDIIISVDRPFIVLTETKNLFIEGGVIAEM